MAIAQGDELRTVPSRGERRGSEKIEGVDQEFGAPPSVVFRRLDGLGVSPVTRYRSRQHRDDPIAVVDEEHGGE